MLIGSGATLIGLAMIIKFGRLGAISQRFQEGKSTQKDMDYINRQPSWIINNPAICSFLGNIAPLVVIVGIFLMRDGI